MVFASACLCCISFLDAVMSFGFVGLRGDAENAGVEFAALNGYGKPLQNLKSTRRRYTTQRNTGIGCTVGLVLLMVRTSRLLREREREREVYLPCQNKTNTYTS